MIDLAASAMIKRQRPQLNAEKKVPSSMLNVEVEKAMGSTFLEHGYRCIRSYLELLLNQLIIMLMLL